MELRKKLTRTRFILTFLIFFFVIDVFLLMIGFYWSDASLHNSLGTLGDFLGGFLNPIFGFATVCLLVWSIQVQLAELKATRQELSETKVVHKEAVQSQLQGIMLTSALKDYELLMAEQLEIWEIQKLFNWVDYDRITRITGHLHRLYKHRPFNGVNGSTVRIFDSHIGNAVDLLDKALGNLLAQMNLLHDMKKNRLPRMTYHYKFNDARQKINFLHDWIQEDKRFEMLRESSSVIHGAFQEFLRK